MSSFSPFNTKYNNIDTYLNRLEIISQFIGLVWSKDYPEKKRQCIHYGTTSW